MICEFLRAQRAVIDGDCAYLMTMLDYFEGEIYDAWLQKGQKGASEENLGVKSAEITNIRQKISQDGTPGCSKPACAEGPRQDCPIETGPSKAAEQAVATAGAT